ncbi:MAG: peptidoglycan-binding protein [Nitrosarchaeum sp.]|nr:peptidoglycan-binding protein [Nitrosarchaeum sp.]
MKKNIFSFFLLLAVAFSPVLASNQAFAQSATGQNNVPCTVLKVPPVLKMGSTGPEVVKLQIALKGMGYLNIPQSIPLGFYGFKTKAAVTQAQIDWNIVPFDGIVGLKTATWIKNITCAAAQGLNANLNNPNLTNTNTGNQNQQNNQQQNNQQNQNQQNNQQNNQQQNQQPGVTQNLSAPCVANVTAPFIEVDSPNGGESYLNTDVLNIKWSTCNIAPDAAVKIAVLHLNDIVLTAGTTNTTGSFAIQLTPALIMNPLTPPVAPIAFDHQFKVQVFTNTPAGVQVTDMSDNNFAILDAGINPNPNPGPVAPNVPVNPNQGWPLGCVWPLGVVNVLNVQPCPPAVNPAPNPNPNNPTVATDVCAQSPLPHVVIFAPNGLQKFQIGTPMDVLWFNCNIPAGVDVRISLVQMTNAGVVRYGLNDQTANDNFETVKLIALPGSPVLQPGDNYQVMLDFVITPAYAGPANPPWLHWGRDFSDGPIKLVN